MQGLPETGAGSENRWSRQSHPERYGDAMCMMAILEVQEDSVLQRLSGATETTLCDLNSN